MDRVRRESHDREAMSNGDLRYVQFGLEASQRSKHLMNVNTSLYRLSVMGLCTQ